MWRLALWSLSEAEKARYAIENRKVSLAETIEGDPWGSREKMNRAPGLARGIRAAPPINRPDGKGR